MTVVEPRKLLALVLAVCLIAAVAIGVGFTSLRNRKWADLEARVEALRLKQDSPLLARLPLGRSLAPGNAWDDYIAANPHVPGKASRIGGSTIYFWLRKGPESARPEIEALVTEFATSIELLRKGTRREFAKAPTAAIVSKGLGSQDLVWLCVAKARFLAEGGGPTEALDLLVDTCLFGRDVAGARGSGTVTTGIHVMDTALLEMKDLLERREIPRAELQRLARTLQLLDEDFPDASVDLQTNLLDFGLLLQREDRTDQVLLVGSGGERSRRRWRTCFSSRLQAAADFADAEDIVRRALEFKGKPWSIAGPGNQALFHELHKSGNELLSHNLNHLPSVQSAMATRGLLRLLRTGVHYKAEGEILELEDPGGGTIQSRLTEQTRMFWRPVFIPGEPKKRSRDYDQNAILQLPQKRP